ncbi:TPA: hypothetical protein ACGFXY_002214 [Vibrio cholerae]
MPIKQYMLSELGIGYGNYFLNITSGRIRVTHSDLEYKPEEKGLTAQKILQHSLNVAQNDTVMGILYQIKSKYHKGCWH